MLNGKFFTGLPPKMMDRGNSSVRNRLESQLFWPDDTHVDTAVESRIKRRNSMQLASHEKPSYQKQNSVADNDVDTKRRFTKEFSQSSIKFYDNLNDNHVNSRNFAANKKMEITDKPTNTKLELPDSIVNEAYTVVKKNQAYNSKIKFYDYANEGDEVPNNRNNFRKPKMDMNDKRELELNSKNSPKLQIKRGVRSLSEEKEMRKINNRNAGTIEKLTRSNVNRNYNEREEENYLKSRRSVEPRRTVVPRRGLAKQSRGEPESFSYETYKPEYYDHYEEKDYRRPSEESNTYKSGSLGPRDYESSDDTLPYRRKVEVPTTISRNNNRKYYENADNRDYSQMYQAQDEIENKMRHVHLHSPPARKQYFAIEDYYDDEPLHYYGQNNQIKTSNNRGDNSFDYNENALSFKDPKKTNGDSQSNYKIYNQIQQEPVASPISPSPSDAESSFSGIKPQKHLRSSLCFNNGEIVGENNTTGSPTSSQYSTQRRNARSSATQRVSVGLPD